MREWSALMLFGTASKPFNALASDPAPSEKRALLRDFARVSGWHPSDTITSGTTDDVATAHLLVEMGLEDAAVISFP